MPGLASCVRCESTLVIGDVSVVPMRASSLRLKTRLNQVQNQVRAIAPLLQRIRMPNWVPRSTNHRLWPSLIRTVIPGLGHRYLGHHIAGWLLFCTWLGLLIAGLATFPSASSIWFFSLAVVTHSVAVISLFAEDLSFQGYAMRGAFGLLLFLGLWWLVYSPLGWISRGFWVPMIVPGNLTPGEMVNVGDGLLYEGRWFRPSEFARGDLVLYFIPAMRGQNYYSLEGNGIDRIVGIPGDTVEIKSGKLLVNGVPPPDNEMPLGSLRLIPDLEMVLVAGEYAIFPTRIEFRNGTLEQQRALILQIIRTPDDLILGRIRFRLQPWSRFGTVH